MAKRKETIQTNANLTAVLHKAGRTWCALVADTQGNKPRIVDAQEFRSEDSTRLNTFIGKHRPAKVICALPASSVICRTVDLPDVPESQLASVLQLQAEAHLTGIAPSHRLAMAPLSTAAGETSRHGVILAWPESATPDIPEIDRHVTFTSDIAGLIGIIGKNRPAQPLAVVDRNSGAIGIAMPHAAGIRYRASCENDGDTDAWSKRTVGVFAETAINAGHDDAFIDSMMSSLQQTLRTIDPGESRLVVPAEIMNTLTTRVNGAKADVDWWSKFGIGVGVLLACHDGFHMLTEIQQDPPQEKPSRILQFASALSTPRAAVLTIAACLILMGTLPTLMTGLRLAALNVRHSDLQNELTKVKRAEKQLEMYRLLDEQAWPMSKLLADLAANTPPGIELETIRVTQGETVTVSGTARPSGDFNAFQLIANMQRNMQESRIFTNVTYSLGDRSKMVGSYAFDLTALVADPHRPVDYDDHRDFAKFTMQQRVDGKGPDSDAASEEGAPADAIASAAGNTQPSPINETPERPTTPVGNDPAVANADDATTSANVEDDDRESRGPRDLNRRGTLGGDNLAGSTRDEAKNESANTKVMPELLTKDQVGQMDRQQVMEALTEVANAKRDFRNDEEALEKLDGQFQMLMARLREIK